VPALSATRARGRGGVALDPLHEAVSRVDPNSFMNHNELVEIN
jgi:hypothetical protein